MIQNIAGLPENLSRKSLAVGAGFQGVHRVHLQRWKKVSFTLYLLIFPSIRKLNYQPSSQVVLSHQSCVNTIGGVKSYMTWGEFS